MAALLATTYVLGAAILSCGMAIASGGLVWAKRITLMRGIKKIRQKVSIALVEHPNHNYRDITMDNIYPHAAALGVIQGITEFLPISSTGHLLFFSEIFALPGDVSKSFDIIIQLGSIFAVLWVYFDRIMRVAVGSISEHRSRHFITVILIAFMPAMVIGGGFHTYIKAHLYNTQVVGIALIIGGAILLVIERFIRRVQHSEIERIPFLVAVGIGLFQCLALIPGTSRSGATIIGALLMGVERRAAVEFSFFLAIPTMIAATSYEIYKSWHQLTWDGGALIAVGFFLAFIISLLVVKTLIAFITRYGFAPFGFYRIMLGTAILLYYT